MRKTKEFEEFEYVTNLVIHTKCPSKWLLVDRETGEIYQGNHGGYWDRLDPVIKNNDNFTKQPE